MDKNKFALTPPMGWNSWDCYGAAVTEEEVLANADYMAKNMMAHGWEYVVCDIQWYEAGAVSSRYRQFVPLEMDEYSRLIPAVNRFPSSASGKGFRPIADYIHNLGLKFGIHILRGIPRQAVHAATHIKGTEVTARDIAHTYSICSWNTDMYGVNPNAYGAQQYYNSLFELYAQWGVDFVKVDDICVTYARCDNLYSAREEIELIHRAIENCGRDMVLSLSPGPAMRDTTDHLCENANMWRLTADLWDSWDDIAKMFDYCKLWEGVSREGCWPDCDMLPIGHISIRSAEHGLGDRMTRLSHDEQKTMMTLWCIFRSPLMVGAELRDNDEFTLNLLTNDDVLQLIKTSYDARQLSRCGDTVIWTAKDKDGSTYVALFNTDTTETRIECTFQSLGLSGKYSVRDLWAKANIDDTEIGVNAKIPSHSAMLYKLTPKF